MARPNSFSKRENEKNRAAKRLEKQKRKDERKVESSAKSFEDMIAYVDENGNLTDVPPEEQNRKKTEIKLEEIAVSTPKKVEDEETVLKGRVEHFNATKGYGFIKDLASTEKYFFHISNAPKEIAEGEIVFFKTERGVRGINAANIVMA